MKEKFWSDDFQWQDLAAPTQDLRDERIYTLKMGDFLIMPEVDFNTLVLVDPDLRALLN